MDIPVCHGAVLTVAADQMREVDRAMVEDYLDLIQMLENAGHNLARLARALSRQ